MSSNEEDKSNLKSLIEDLILSIIFSVENQLSVTFKIVKQDWKCDSLV